MDRTQFTFYESFYKAIKRIKDPSERAQFYDAVCEYALYGNQPDIDSLSDLAAIAFELIKPNLDAGRKKAENGKSGGSSKQKESKSKANFKQNEANGSKFEANFKQNEANGSKFEANFKQGENSSKKEEENKKENKDKKENKKENKIESEKEKEKESCDSDNGFAIFWSAYPKHKGKADALKAWGKIKPSAELQTTMGKALEAQKQSEQWRKDGGQYIPMPATWLNGKRWEDEVQTQTQPNIPTDADYVPLFDLGF